VIPFSAKIHAVSRLTRSPAGIFGLAAAKTFRQLNPEKSLAILDSGSTLGGVWAEDRLYPGLKANNMLGTFEYPDFPMHTDTFGVKPGEHVPGEVMFKYLTRYAETFGILDKIRYQSAVVSAEHQDGGEGGWILTVRNGDTQRQIFARKLVVAAGLTSEPFLPHIEGQEQFGVPVFHSRDFKKYAGTLDSAKRVTVFGGTKSAWDVVYAYGSKGVKVDWVIRGGSSPQHAVHVGRADMFASSEWPWSDMDCSSLRYPVEEMAGETCP
jgi:cation diffusion facilitator CzcD-associated flavoprotein CzcO